MLDLALVPRLPPRISTFGSTTIEWKEIEPGLALIQTKEGSISTRHLAHLLIASDLEACGYSIYTDQMPNFNTRTGTWTQVMQDAVRLYRDGHVTIQKNSLQEVIATVVGDHGVYQSYVTRQDPSSAVWTSSGCTCPWQQFRWQRTRQWRKYEGRPCKHIMAMMMKSVVTPLEDEQQLPQPSFGQMPEQQQLPNMPENAPGTATYPPNAAPAQDFNVLNQNDPWAQAMPLPSRQQPSQMPPYVTQEPLLQIPMQQDEYLKQLQDQIQNAPISVIQQNPPYPGNPIDGRGTLSHIIYADQGQVFQQGDIVRINVPTMAQKEGPMSAEDQGEWIEIPRNSRGEVFDYDATTGWTVVIFAMPGPPMTVPYPSLSNNARSYVESDMLTLVSRGQGLKSPLVGF